MHGSLLSGRCTQLVEHLKSSLIDFKGVLLLDLLQSMLERPLTVIGEYLIPDFGDCAWVILRPVAGRVMLELYQKMPAETRLDGRTQLKLIQGKECLNNLPGEDIILPSVPLMTLTYNKSNGFTDVFVPKVRIRCIDFGAIVSHNLLDSLWCPFDLSQSLSCASCGSAT